jgi:hypothetical protein
MFYTRPMRVDDPRMVRHVLDTLLFKMPHTFQRDVRTLEEYCGGTAAVARKPQLISAQDSITSREFIKRLPIDLPIGKNVIALGTLETLHMALGKKRGGMDHGGWSLVSNDAFVMCAYVQAVTNTDGFRVMLIVKKDAAYRGFIDGPIVYAGAQMLRPKTDFPPHERQYCIFPPGPEYRPHKFCSGYGEFDECQQHSPSVTYLEICILLFYFRMECFVLADSRGPYNVYFFNEPGSFDSVVGHFNARHRQTDGVSLQRVVVVGTPVVKFNSNSPPHSHT